MVWNRFLDLGNSSLETEIFKLYLQLVLGAPQQYVTLRGEGGWLLIIN